jgi:hypothetical protein
VEDRLPTGAVEGLKRSGLTDDEIYSLIVPRRTLTHRRTRGGALSRDESDRAVRLAVLPLLRNMSSETVSARGTGFVPGSDNFMVAVRFS